MIDISIIIPHYNTPKLLKRLLDSIPKRNNIEIIVIDDNSTNELECYRRVISSPCYDHISFIQRQSNMGAGACRNAGIRASNGKWLFFADADDFFLDDFYETADKYLSSDYDVVFFPPTSIDAYANIASCLNEQEIIRNYLASPTKRNELALRYETPAVWSKLIRKDFLIDHSITFDEVLVGEDEMFSTKVGYNTVSFCASDDSIYCATTNKGSATKTISVERFNMKVDVIIEKARFLRDHLSEHDFVTLDYAGQVTLKWAVIYKIGLKNFIKLIVKLRRNGVSLLAKKYWDPSALVKRAAYHYNNYKKEESYFVAPK